MIPIQNSTHFSLLNSISTPETLVKRAANLGYGSVGLTDYNSLSGAIEFASECKKNKVKPIIGTKLRVDNNQYLTLVSKNLNGWKTLVKIISDSHSPENHIAGKASLKSEKLKEYDLSNLLVILGDLESELYNTCFSLYGFCATSDNEAQIGISLDVIDKVKNYIFKYKELFGDRTFVQINFLNKNIPYQKTTSYILREVAEENDIKCIAGVNSHYTNKDNAEDLRLLMCSDQKTTFNNIDLSNWKNSVFFRSKDFDIPTLEEVKSIYTEEEIENTNLIDSLCEKYDLTSKPLLPKFDCPNGLSEIDYLRELSNTGYSSKKKENWDTLVYGDRVNTELGVVDKAGLAGYFLIVADYINWAKARGYLVGPARGSSAGSLTCYLTGITEVDPIPYKLIFERFYNEGRNSGDNVAYPDIDVDFPMFAREEVIKYVTNKYGQDKVGSISTFGRLQGRSALREVFRVHNATDINTINQISKLLPHEHKIADKLEEEGEDSIIRWTLKNEPKLLEDYVRMTDDEKIVGDLAPFFEQAIRIEGVYKSQGKHAAGIIICAEPLETVAPMIYHSESKQKIVGFEMKAAEKAGLIKMDMLGINLLDKCMLVRDMLKGKY